MWIFFYKRIWRARFARVICARLSASHLQNKTLSGSDKFLLHFFFSFLLQSAWPAVYLARSRKFCVWSDARLLVDVYIPPSFNSSPFHYRSYRLRERIKKKWMRRAAAAQVPVVAAALISIKVAPANYSNRQGPTPRTLQAHPRKSQFPAEREREYYGADEKSCVYSSD